MLSVLTSSFPLLPVCTPPCLSLVYICICVWRQHWSPLHVLEWKDLMGKKFPPQETVWARDLHPGFLINCQASENWSQPKWGPWQLVWSVRPVAREWGKGGGCRLEGRNGFWKFTYAPGKEDGSMWLEANSPLIPTLGESQRGQSAEGSRIGFVSSFTYLRMCRREEKMSNLEKCKQVIAVHGKQVSLTLHKKHLKVLTSWHVR